MRIRLVVLLSTFTDQCIRSERTAFVRCPAVIDQLYEVYRLSRDPLGRLADQNISTIETFYIGELSNCKSPIRKDMFKPSFSKFSPEQDPHVAYGGIWAPSKIVMRTVTRKKVRYGLPERQKNLFMWHLHKNPLLLWLLLLPLTYSSQQVRAETNVPSIDLTNQIPSLCAAT